MKTKILKGSVAMLLAVLTLLSVIAVAAFAEELLPGAYGGAIYTDGNVETAGCQFGDYSGNTQEELPTAGGAIITSGEIVMSEEPFTNSAPENISDYGGSIIISEKEVENRACMSGTDADAAPVPGECAEENQTGTPVVSEDATQKGNTPETDAVSQTPNADETAATSEVSEESGIAKNNELSEESASVETTGGNAADSNDENIGMSGNETAEEIRKSSGTSEDIETLNSAEQQIANNAEESTAANEGNDNGESAANKENETEGNSTEPTEGEGMVATEEQTEISVGIDENAAEAGIIAGIDAEAKVIPGPRPHDPDEEALRGKNEKICQTVGDVIVKIGESVIPFGPTISNIIRARSPQGKDMDHAETVIDLAADTAAYMCPIAAPIVSVVKDIALKIRRCF